MVKNWRKNEEWLKRICPFLEQQFPNLAFTGYTLLTPDTVDYNCVAWAAEHTNRWWWPIKAEGVEWPDDVPMEVTLEAFIKFFQRLGYENCPNDDLEVNFQKIAIYTDNNQIPTHVARQLRNGKWTSKIGPYECLEHNKLEGLMGEEPAYGKVACFMKKPLNYLE